MRRIFIFLLSLFWLIQNVSGGTSFTFTDHAWLLWRQEQPSVTESNNLLDNLTAWWPHEETNGGNRLSLTNTHDLINYGTVLREANHKEGSFASGMMELNYLTNYDAEFLVTSNWSMSGWFMFTNTPGGNDTIVSRWGPGTSWFLTIASVGSNIVRFDVTDSGQSLAYSVDSKVEILKSNYYHYAMGIDNANVWLQVNNETRSNTPYTTLFASTDPLAFGYTGIVPVGNETGTFFDATGFWNRPLGTNDVRQLYNGGNGLFFSSFRGSGGGGGTEWIDSSSFTPSGSPVNNAGVVRLGEKVITTDVAPTITDIGVYVVAGSTHVHTLEIKLDGDCGNTVVSTTLDFNGLSAGVHYVHLNTPVTLNTTDNYFAFVSAVDGEDSFYLGQTITHTSIMTCPNAAYAVDTTSCTSVGTTDQAHGPVFLKYTTSSFGGAPQMIGGGGENITGAAGEQVIIP